MTILKARPALEGLVAGSLRITAQLAIIGGIAVMVTACKTDDDLTGAHVAGWAMIEADQRHPILVSKEPANLTVRVARGSTGLTPAQRSSVVDFLNRYRGGDGGQGRLAVRVPSGSPNEIAALHVVADLKELLNDYGVDESRLAISSYQSDREPQPPIRVSYTTYVAEAPECGNWTANLAYSPQNLPAPDFGCSTQHNLAVQVANPADLLGPRTMTQRAGERRDVIWDKFIKGESTIAKKDGDEKIQTSGGGN